MSISIRKIVTFSNFSFFLEFIKCVFEPKIEKMTPLEVKKDLSMFKSGKILIMDVQEKLHRNLKKTNSSFEDLNSNRL